MAAGTFTITERPDIGGSRPPGGSPAKFEWNSDGRNSPIGSWEVTLTQRTVRTDYPGTDTVSEQVLGPNYEPFTLSGKWRDKFNPQALTTASDIIGSQGLVPPGQESFRTTDFRSIGQAKGGYAQKTLKAFTEMVRRGNPVTIAYNSDRGNLEFVGLITGFTFDYIRPWEIGYEFTVSPHTRTEDLQFSNSISETQARDPAAMAQEVQEKVEALRDAQSLARKAQIAQTKVSDAEALVALIEGDAAQLATVIDQRVLSTDNNSNVSLRRAVGASDGVFSNSVSFSNLSRDRKSSTALVFSTPLSVLNFETWSRGSAYQSRQTSFAAWETRQSLDRLEDPDAIALYRPYKGESLYGVSNRFYNTPHNWKIIKEANKLPTSNLQGTELLVIPKAPVT